MTGAFRQGLAAIEHMTAEEAAQVACVALGHVRADLAFEAVIAAFDDADLGELAEHIAGKLAEGAVSVGAGAGGAA